MATLLHHIHHGCKSRIGESEARVERKMEDMMDRKVQPPIIAWMPSNESPRRPTRQNISSLQADIASLRSTSRPFLPHCRRAP
ncbi:hypothetical protein H5410_027504 [Solanum commersonii]|uniref:Uncharacterized protein n=1 Tax=Solanum commersonii TaxID=4109 RepID=A0A9J5Z3J9_SOLCO|nr:hypothetical protein H5410_027504 [Solanum commersonii]